MLVQCPEHVGGFFIFSFVRYFTVGILLDDIDILPVLHDTVLAEDTSTRVFLENPNLFGFTETPISWNLPLPNLFVACPALGLFRTITFEFFPFRWSSRFFHQLHSLGWPLKGAWQLDNLEVGWVETLVVGCFVFHFGPRRHLILAFKERQISVPRFQTLGKFWTHVLWKALGTGHVGFQNKTCHYCEFNIQNLPCKNSLPVCETRFHTKIVLEQINIDPSWAAINHEKKAIHYQLNLFFFTPSKGNGDIIRRFVQPREGR